MTWSVSVELRWIVARCDFNAWKLKDNWKPRLHNLLWIEEAEGNDLRLIWIVNILFEGKKWIRKFDLQDIQIERVEAYMTDHGLYPTELPTSRIPCEGLAEKRPSGEDLLSIYLI